MKNKKNVHEKSSKINGWKFKALIIVIFIMQLLISIPLHAQLFVNGDFETGDFTGWTDTGPHSANVVQYQGSWSGHISILTGNASNSGTPNEFWKMVGQTILIPEAAISMSFYMGVEALPGGGNYHSGGYVWIMDADSVGTYSLLYNTGGGGGSATNYPWEFHEVSIETWAGKEATLYFAGHNSNGVFDHKCDIYFDNVSFPDLIPPTVTVDVPNGGEVWMVGDTYQIQWTDDDNMGIYFNEIFYSTFNGANWILIESFTGNPQTYDWLIPSATSSFCLIKVVVYDAGGNPAEDVSDAVFTITADISPPTVEITSPNGGENWEVFEWYQVTWIADDDVSVIGDSVFYSTNNGTDWTLLCSQTGNPQSYSWQIPNALSNECLIKVVAWDAGGNSTEDVSDAVFSIVGDTSPPTVEIVSPNGGENWEVFEWHQITWIADDDVGVVGDSVYFSTNNGTDWDLLTSDTGNPQSYSWQIPNIPSGECLIKVVAYDLIGNCNDDISAATFTIFYNEPLQPDYAVIIKQSTYNDPDWQAVADALQSRYQGELFIWSNSLDEVLNDVADFEPTHIGFVCDVQTATPNFIQNTIWPFTRNLDGDVYCDAVWGIITGYEAEDALDNINGPIGFNVRTVLGGTDACDLEYYPQGIRTYEEEYNRYDVKYPDSNEIEEFTDGPTDRTEWLVTMLNEGIDIFGNNPVDIFYTNGHSYHNNWQLHFPSTGQEGYFRSSEGQVYGEPNSGSFINVNSDNPKIYFGLGNSNIGQIYSNGSMAPSWIHTGGASQFTGYLINEEADSYQHGSTKAYFYKVARTNTWAEAFLLGNIVLQYDLINGTPGTNPPDLDGSVLYGDPGMQIKMSHQGEFITPLFTSELIINEGTNVDTVTFKITMNREGNPGFTGKWGERHPAIIFPFRAKNIEIISTNAIDAIVEDNFALMYIWYQGQPSLAEGETREVTFTYNLQTGVEEQILTETSKVILYQNYPNPFSTETTITFSLAENTESTELSIYNITGQKVMTLINKEFSAGKHSIIWKGDDKNNKQIPAGIYYYKIKTGKFSETKEMILIR